MWNRIIRIADWFGNIYERNKLIIQFNKAAKESFINGIAPTLLKASISKGDPNYRHQFSSWLYSGFRIKSLSGNNLSKSELIEIGKVVLDNENLTRKLITLGWDTLEIHSNVGKQGIKWELKKYINFNTFIE